MEVRYVIDQNNVENAFTKIHGHTDTIRRRYQVKKKTPLMKIIYLGFILCLMISVILVGCGEPEETEPSPTTSTTGPTTTATTTTATTTPPPTTPAIKTGGILKVAMPMDAMILGDPLETKQVGAIMQRAALEFLARFDSDGMLQPWLAESWTEDPDNLTFTINLKEGIKFHDGSDFNAEAVKWNWERFIADNSGYTSSVSSIETVGDYTVVVHLSAWNNALPYNMCFWAGAMVSKTAWEENGEDWGALNPVGTGPFKFVSWEPESLIVFEKYDGYWQEGKPYLDGIEFHIIADEATRTASFKAGEVDMINQATIVQTHTLAEEGNYVVADLKNGIGTRIDFLTFDAANPDSVFADIRVRQAVAHAIDRETIVDTTFYGYAVPTNQYGAPDNWAYNPNLTDYPYDPDAARALLAEAGHPSIETTITVFDNETQFTAISGMLAEVGIDAKVNLVPGGAWFQAATQGWEGILGTPSPPDGDVSTRFGFSTTTSMFCVSQLRPEENDTLVNAMTSATSFEEKKALTQAYQERIWGELVTNVALWIMDNMAVKYPYVQDDGFCMCDGHGWTPENAWLDK